MKALDKKLLRDLWGMKGQFLAIALVIASGVATFVMSLSTLDSLSMTREAYYADYRFADVFAPVKRAPESLKARISGMQGVETVETRVVAPVNLDIEGFPEPVVGRIISIPGDGEPLLNRLYMRNGRYNEPGRDNEVVVNESFAEAHGLKPGDKIGAIINGRQKALTIAGIALNPEYIYQIGPGAVFPDFKRFGVLWMGRAPLAAAFGMEGSFNDIALTLTPGASLEDVVSRLDAVLAPYGGAGAFGRKDQTSHHFLSEELRQLGTLAAVFPVIFLGVAAFLLNVVMGRLISTEREQIAVLKAFGYANRAIAVHYTKLVIVAVLMGVAMGIGLGIWFGKGLSNIYMGFYKFPFLRYELMPRVVAEAVFVSVAGAMLGTLHAVRRAALLPPAEAMRPEPPASYRETVIERMGLGRFLSQPTRMIFRHIERRPIKSLLSIIGIAFACGIMMTATFQDDAITYIVDAQFGQAQREDLAVTFVEPASGRAKGELMSMNGVLNAEPFRAVPVRLKFRNKSFRTLIQGFKAKGDLHRLLDARLRPVELSPDGIVLTDYLGKYLGVRPGETITVEVLEGARPVKETAVESFVSEFVGASAYMEIGALNRFMKEGDVISGAFLAVDEPRQNEIYTALKHMPRVAGTVIHKRALESFYETLAETVLFFTFVAALLGGTISFGVVYNSARINLAERGRELASLRVLGFTKAEISYILLGELAALTLAAIPVGFLIGQGLCAYLVSKLQTDLYRIPLVLNPDTYAFAAAVVLGSAVISGLIVRREIDRLDLVAVLKTKE
ncbi:MAG: ABC transporter permease [Deltaproteobacteria bacterium]|nr:ABC transporter permease [Deltaproteobacteria bacterium]